MKNDTLLVIFILFVYILLEGNAQAKQSARFQHMPFAAKECESCHESEKPSDKDLAFAVPELCHNCHDEYSGNYFHIPSSAGECLSCHAAHESDFKSLLKIDQPDICYSCHDKLKERMYNSHISTHAPADNNCTVCHSPHASDTSRKLLKKDVKILCTECHQKEGITTSVEPARITFKHKPYETDSSCLHCHSPHATDYENLLLQEELDLCLHCHDKEVTGSDGDSLVNIEELLKENTNHHGPIKEKNCSGCHSPHGSNFYRLLLAEYPRDFYTETFDMTIYTLCFNCHDSALFRDRETATLTKFRDGNRNLHYLHVNMPEKGRTCRACHEIHASNNFNHMRDSVPFGKIEWPLKLNYVAEYVDVNSGNPCDKPGNACVKSGGSCVACHDRKYYDNTR